MLHSFECCHLALLAASVVTSLTHYLLTSRSQCITVLLMLSHGVFDCFSEDLLRTDLEPYAKIVSQSINIHPVS